jgi:hypothetical protein
MASRATQKQQLHLLHFFPLSSFGLSISAATTAIFFAGLLGSCDLTKSTFRFLAILVGKILLPD